MVLLLLRHRVEQRPRAVLDKPGTPLPQRRACAAAGPARRYMQGHGRTKVMFGTNYPMITAAKALEDLDRLGLDDEAKQLFLHGNAARVFDLAPR